MKKEEIIKNIISSTVFIPNGEPDYYRGNLNGTNLVMVDLNKLAKFLAKYVVKEDLIEE